VVSRAGPRSPAHRRLAPPRPRSARAWESALQAAASSIRQAHLQHEGSDHSDRGRAPPHQRPGRGSASAVSASPAASPARERPKVIAGIRTPTVPGQKLLPHRRSRALPPQRHARGTCIASIIGR
jgi:hypothetical protein